MQVEEAMKEVCEKGGLVAAVFIVQTENGADLIRCWINGAVETREDWDWLQKAAIRVPTIVGSAEEGAGHA